MHECALLWLWHTTAGSQYEEVSLGAVTKCFLFDKQTKCLSFKGRKSVKWKEQMPKWYLALVWHTLMYISESLATCVKYMLSLMHRLLFLFWPLQMTSRQRFIVSRVPNDVFGVGWRLHFTFQWKVSVGVCDVVIM